MKRWKSIGVRSYKLSDGDFDAFIFGATQPTQLWAWSVYWKNGHSSWVEHSFKAAKNKANECIRELREHLS